MCASRFSAGTLYYYAAWGDERPEAEREPERFAADLRCYLTRKIGFEAAMQVCSLSLSLSLRSSHIF